MATNNIALPPFWKKIIKETDVENLLPLNNHLIKKNIHWYWETKFKGVILAQFYKSIPLHQHLESILTNYLKLTGWAWNKSFFYPVW